MVSIYEPEAPQEGKAPAAVPGASSRLSSTGAGRGVRVLQRRSTDEVMQKLEKRRKLAQMEKETALAETEALLVARHRAANGRLWQGQGQGQEQEGVTTTLATSTPAAAPGSVVAR